MAKFAKHIGLPILAIALVVAVSAALLLSGDSTGKLSASALHANTNKAQKHSGNPPTANPATNINTTSYFPPTVNKPIKPSKKHKIILPPPIYTPKPIPPILPKPTPLPVKPPKPISPPCNKCIPGRGYMCPMAVGAVAPNYACAPCGNYPSGLMIACRLN